jgi:cytidine deaminase
MNEMGQKSFLRNSISIGLDGFIAAYSTLPILVQTLLRTGIADSGVLPGDVGTQIMRLMGFSDLGELMIMLLPGAAAFARVPISGFPVGAVVAGMSIDATVPNLYLGANFEFAHEALTCAVHAEQSATNNAWCHGERCVQAIAISTVPCGHCRQFLNEFVTDKNLSILLPQADTMVPQTYHLSHFLPDAFGPKNLGLSGGIIRSGHKGTIITNSDLLVQSAVTAMNASYAPYTKNFAGVALKAVDGIEYCGSYIENAAYTPSMSPLQSAIAYMNMNRPIESSLAISRAVLVESPTCISQHNATKTVLSFFAPRVPLEYYIA